jgi:hypothetical protein
MRSFFLISIFLISIFLVSIGYAQQQSELGRLKKQLELYKKRTDLLNNSLTLARKREAKLDEEVAGLRTRLEALGLYGGSKDDRLLQAVSDGKVLHEQLSTLRLVGEQSLAEFKKFVAVASVIDPKRRQEVEVALRRFETALLGMSEEKKERNKFGTLQDARVISIDTLSGMLVLNIGSERDCKVGMTFRFHRGDRELGEGVVTEVRKNISGVLVTTRKDQSVIFKVGDKGSVKVQR